MHVKHYASSRLEAAGCAKLAKGAAAICGAIGAAVMFALTWLGDTSRSHDRPRSQSAKRIRLT